MAKNVIFKKGAGRPTITEEGVLYFSTDLGLITLGLATGKIEFTDIVALDTKPTDVTGMVDGKLYMNADGLYFKNGTALVTVGNAGDIAALKTVVDKLDADDTHTDSVKGLIKAAKEALIGTAASDTKDSNTIAGAKKYADDKVANVPTYTIKKLDTPSANAAATYQLHSVAKDKTETPITGAIIDIAKDMVVQSGTVETYTDDNKPTGVTAGTYLVLTLANATNDKVYIPANDLIEYVTSGTSATDDVQIAISADHKVTTDATVLHEKIYGDTVPSTDPLTLKSLDDKIKSGGTEWGDFNSAP